VRAGLLKGRWPRHWQGKILYSQTEIQKFAKILVQRNPQQQGEILKALDLNVASLSAVRMHRKNTQTRHSFFQPPGSTRDAIFRVVEDVRKIKELQAKFENALKSYQTEEIRVTIGHPGKSFPRTVYWSPRLDLWMYFELISGSRYWNVFGVGKPKANSSVPIACEINIPLKGIDMRVAGAFATDGTQDEILVHSGKIGGGRKGIGKQLFGENYRGEWASVHYGKSERWVAPIGDLNSNRFARQISDFVHEVLRIKAVASSPQPKKAGVIFNKEFAGIKQYQTGKIVVAKCDHGLVLNCLAHELAALGLYVGNDKYRDLFVLGPKSVPCLIFEVKTDTSTSSLYTGVGQLLLNNDTIMSRRLVLVLPSRVIPDFEKKLRGLGIKLLDYDWSDDIPVFHGLERLVKEELTSD
jgi:hypothetical protein